MTTEPLSASQMAKACGLPSLKYVTDKTGTSKETLINWHRSKPALFRVVLVGCETLHAEEQATGTTLEAKTEDSGDGVGIHG